MKRVLAGAALGLALTSLAGLPTAATAAPDAPATARSVTVTPMHFKTTVGSQVCDIVADLYLPGFASAVRRVPAIMTTNGFGGSKADQAGFGRSMARRGFAVLSYSGLGFGGSGCKITLDDPDVDGVAGRQLISYLGGQTGIAFEDAAHRVPLPALDVIRTDPVAHDGVRRAHDPRVGMIGGSYGGQVQFAVASVDPRLDTIVPMITWNDLTYSLAPNNATAPAYSVTVQTPGAAKLAWALGFASKGVIDGLNNAQGDPGRLIGCPNFATFVCPALVTAGVTGHLDASAIAKLRHASVGSYLDKIRIPTLLMQGQFDTLFNLNESLATYQALRRQGTEVRMIWHSWGHTHPAPAPGEFNFDNPQPAKQYESRRVLDWFNHYLRDSSVSTGSRFAWFRDWVGYDGNATPAYVEAKTATVGKRRSWFLGPVLTTNRSAAGGSQQFLTVPAGLPLALNPLDALGDFIPAPLPEVEAPGTFTSWQTVPQRVPADVVGSPQLTLRVSAPITAATQAAGPTGMLVIFARLQDVGPDGKATDLKQLTAPVRVPDVAKPFTVTMPAIVHRFDAGHRIRLVVSGSSLNYRGGVAATPVTIKGGPDQRLSLPLVLD